MTIPAHSTLNPQLPFVAPIAPHPPATPCPPTPEGDAR